MGEFGRTGILVLASLAVCGCVYQTSSIDYARQPELRPLLLYTGTPGQQGENLGAVVGEKRGWESCDELAKTALLDLLANAKALGGTGVKDVRFRGRWHWMGRVACRASLLGRSVQVQGVAYRE
jgi:hypothetical protein